MLKVDKKLHIQIAAMVIFLSIAAFSFLFFGRISVWSATVFNLGFDNHITTSKPQLVVSKNQIDFLVEEANAGLQKEIVVSSSPVENRFRWRIVQDISASDRVEKVNGHEFSWISYDRSQGGSGDKINFWVNRYAIQSLGVGNHKAVFKIYAVEPLEGVKGVSEQKIVINLNLDASQSFKSLDLNSPNIKARPEETGPEYRSRSDVFWANNFTINNDKYNAASPENDVPPFKRYEPFSLVQVKYTPKMDSTSKLPSSLCGGNNKVLARLVYRYDNEASWRAMPVSTYESVADKTTSKLSGWNTIRHYLPDNATAQDFWAKGQTCDKQFIFPMPTGNGGVVQFYFDTVYYDGSKQGVSDIFYINVRHAGQSEAGSDLKKMSLANQELVKKDYLGFEISTPDQKDREMKDILDFGVSDQKFIAPSGESQGNLNFSLFHTADEGRIVGSFGTGGLRYDPGFANYEYSRTCCSKSGCSWYTETRSRSYSPTKVSSSAAPFFYGNQDFEWLSKDKLKLNIYSNVSAGGSSDGGANCNISERAWGEVRYYDEISDIDQARLRMPAYQFPYRGNIETQVNEVINISSGSSLGPSSSSSSTRNYKLTTTANFSVKPKFSIETDQKDKDGKQLTENGVPVIYLSPQKESAVIKINSDPVEVTTHWRANIENIDLLFRRYSAGFSWLDLKPAAGMSGTDLVLSLNPDYAFILSDYKKYKAKINIYATSPVYGNSQSEVELPVIIYLQRTR